MRNTNEVSSGDKRTLAVFLSVAVVAIAIPLGVDAAVTRLSTATLFLMSGAITAAGLWLFLPTQARTSRNTLKTPAVARVLGVLFVLGTAISVIALHGFARIGLATASLVPLALAYWVVRRDAG